MPTRAQVGDRRKRKGGLFEKQPSGKWKRVADKKSGSTSAPVSPRRAAPKKAPAKKASKTKWAQKDPLKGLSSDRRRSVLARALAAEEAHGRSIGSNLTRSSPKPPRPKASRPAPKKPEPKKPEPKKPEAKKTPETPASRRRAALKRALEAEEAHRASAGTSSPPKKPEPKAKEEKEAPKKVEPKKPEAREERPTAARPQTAAERRRAAIQRALAAEEAHRDSYGTSPSLTKTRKEKEVKQSSVSAPVEGSSAAHTANNKAFSKLKVGKYNQVIKDDAAAAESKKIFGRDLSDQDYRDLAGAPHGVRMTIKKMGGPNGGLMIVSNGSGYSSERALKRIDGKLVLQNDLFVTSKLPKGSGTTMFAKQVDSATRLGVDRIEVEEAAGYGPKTSWGKRTPATYNGYYTWARLGYEGEARVKSDESRKALASYMDSSGNVSIPKMMSTAEGRKAWRDYGSDWSGNFDLKKGSYSQRVLDAYLEERSKRKK